MNTDPLIEGAKRMHKMEGKRRSSETTRYLHLTRIIRFVHILREMDFGCKLWKNLTNKHVACVVSHWRAQGLSDKTINNYLASIRRVAKFYGNDRISVKNKQFGIERQKSVKNEDKSLPKGVYDQAVKMLEQGLKPYDLRFLSMIRLQRELGLRLEESAKFDPRRSVRPDKTVFVCFGTKGGRVRLVDTITPEGRAAIEYAKKTINGSRNLIPNTPGMTEQKWFSLYFKRMAEIGITRENAGAGSHGNRHAFAQARYEQETMFPPPCKFPNISEFTENAEAVAGNEWQERDSAARTHIACLMGHGPYRNATTSQYLGSSKRSK